ncbi:hypothetical protein [Spirosoma fluminis]
MDINVRVSDEIKIVGDPAGSDAVSIEIPEQEVIVTTDHVYGAGDQEAPDYAGFYQLFKQS